MNLLGNQNLVSQLGQSLCQITAVAHCNWSHFWRRLYSHLNGNCEEWIRMKQNRYCNLFSKLTIFSANVFTNLPNFLIHLFRQCQNLVNMRNVVSTIVQGTWKLVGPFVKCHHHHHHCFLSVINGFPSYGALPL
jgi:hypothetical protein